MCLDKGGSMKTMRRFKTEAEAELFMRLRNQAERQNRRSDLVVLVDGPEDNYVVMSLTEAVENGFLYRWTV